jgi:hypothetical protein
MRQTRTLNRDRHGIDEAVHFKREGIVVGIDPGAVRRLLHPGRRERGIGAQQFIQQAADTCLEILRLLVQAKTIGDRQVAGECGRARAG